MIMSLYVFVKFLVTKKIKKQNIKSKPLKDKLQKKVFMLHI